jgi:hypothetical protein
MDRPGSRHGQGMNKYTRTFMLRHKFLAFKFLEKFIRQYCGTSSFILNVPITSLDNSRINSSIGPLVSSRSRAFTDSQIILLLNGVENSAQRPQRIDWDHSYNYLDCPKFLFTHCLHPVDSFGFSPRFEVYMSQREQSNMPQSTFSGDSPSATAKDSSSKLSDEWSEVKDPNERRKIQNKLAQRRFRKGIIEDDWGERD